VEHTDEEGNVTYEWADPKSACIVVNFLIRINYHVSYSFVSRYISKFYNTFLKIILLLQGKYDAEAAKAIEASGQELTVADSDSIWHSITDPPTRGRRYGFGN